MLVDLNGGPRWRDTLGPFGGSRGITSDPRNRSNRIDNMGGSCWILVLGPVYGLFPFEPVSVFWR